MTTVVAVALIAAVSALLADRVRARPRALVAFATTVALTCAGYGLCDAFATRARDPFPLTFHDAAGAAVAVHVDHVTAPTASPRALALFAIALAPLAGWARRRSSRRAAFTGRSDRPGSRLALAIVVAAALPYALTLVAGWVAPPRGYDALWYHLPMATGFSRAAHLEPPGRDLVFYFPGNVELWARTLYDAFGARVLGVVQWPFAIGAAWGAFALARAIGFRRGAPFGAALVLAAPTVVFQSALAYTDVAALFAIGVAALLLVAAVRAETLGDALGRAALGGLALGLLAGAKYAALPLLAALAPPLALYAFTVDGGFGLRRAPRAALLLSVVALAIAVPSWFWYARNLRLTDNPFFPVALPSLGLRGLFRSSAFNPGKELEFVGARWRWLLYPWTERTSHESGFGAAFATLVPVGVVALGAAFLRRLRRGRLPAFGLPLAWGVVYLALWWIGTPHEPRHLLPLLILLGVPSLGLLEHPAARRPLGVALAVAIGFSTVISLRTLCYSTTPELSARPRSAAALYDLPAQAVKLIPDGARVANLAGRPANFPLLGPDRTWRLFDYSAVAPSAADLAWNRVDFVYYRGALDRLAVAPGWRLVYRGPAVNAAWWEARAGDEIFIFRTR